MKMIYMDAGSGARRPITTEMIERVSRKHRNTIADWWRHSKSGKKCTTMPGLAQTIIVVGNAIEKDASLLAEMASALHSVSLLTPNA
ncbi:MAG: hypothetical protein WDM78_22670 [Puia sp.]